MSEESKENLIPRILIAAEKSGCGKTTFTCGLLQVLLNRGYRPLSFKCGPDYIDPLFHERILGVESNNLDSYFLDEEGVRRVLVRSFRKDSSEKDISAGENGGEKQDDGEKQNSNPVAVIEGVMGIYDGLSPVSNEGSCYEIADFTKTGIILLVDAQGTGKTLISRIKGILSEDGKGLIRGVILNRISESYYEKIKPCMEEAFLQSGFDAKVLGFLPKADGIFLDSRHLGLKLPGEVEDLKERIAKTAELIEAHCDTNGILNLMKASAGLTCTESPEAEKKENGPLTLAVAKDEAFCFYYRENLRLFEERGVRIRYFSPIHDAAVPEDADGVLLGGGYPENYAEELSGNCFMRESLKSAIESGMPSLAECGGFLYLHKELKTKEGKIYPMAGLIEASAEYTNKSVRFGYLEVKSCKNACFQSLEGLRGHEFHYFESNRNGSDCVLKKASTGKEYESLIVKERSVWGFAHFYYASRPDLVEEFIEAMRKYKNSAGKERKPVEIKAEDVLLAQTGVKEKSLTKELNSARFFANHACEYYPCHKCNVEINCLFCFCPLYHLDCPGNYTMKESGGKLKKNCKDCVFPHLPQNYEKVMKILKEQSPDRSGKTPDKP